MTRSNTCPLSVPGALVTSDPYSQHMSGSTGKAGDWSGSSAWHSSPVGMSASSAHQCFITLRPELAARPLLLWSFSLPTPLQDLNFLSSDCGPAPGNRSCSRLNSLASVPSASKHHHYPVLLRRGLETRSPLGFNFDPHVLWPMTFNFDLAFDFCLVY